MRFFCICAKMKQAHDLCLQRWHIWTAHDSSLLQADYNVRVTSQVVNDYIKDAVQARLAFDIPSSWRLFMVSSASPTQAIGPM